MRRIVLIPLLALAACSYSTVEAEPALEEPFTLEPGEVVGVADTGVRVRLVGVPEDSRCPTDVVCVWEGDARVVVEVETAGDPARSYALHTSGAAAGGSRTVEVGGYVLGLVDVTPEPHSERRIDADEYRVTLRLSASVD